MKWKYSGFSEIIIVIKFIIPVAKNKLWLELLILCTKKKELKQEIIEGAIIKYN